MAGFAKSWQREWGARKSPTSLGPGTEKWAKVIRTANIKLQCEEKNGGRTFNLVHDWVIEKGSLRLMPVPSGYRCLLPHPTKPDLS
jgi:hypothetical protein